MCGFERKASAGYFFLGKKVNRMRWPFLKYMKPKIKILHTLNSARWREYKNLKLESLRSAPLAFFPGLEKFQNFSDGGWKKNLKNIQKTPNGFMFAEIECRLVGMVVIVIILSFVIHRIFDYPRHPKSKFFKKSKRFLL